MSDPMNVSMNTGSLSGISNTNELDGLDPKEAQGKVFTALGKLDKREEELTTQINKDQTDLKKLESDIAAWKKELSGMNGWDKFWSSRDEKLSSLIRGAESQLAPLKTKIANGQNELAQVNKDQVTLGAVNDVLKQEMAAKAASLREALASGDFESALSMVMEDKIGNLDRMLKTKVEAMDARNQQILELNNQLASLKGDPEKNASQITKIQGQIDKLNSDSQLDMIKLQSLTTKRNQAHELLSNLINKFSQTMDKLVSNIR